MQRVTLLVVALTLDSAIALTLLRENETASRRKPNILLLFPDQWRFDWDGLTAPKSGSLPLRMPTVQQIAQQGVRFTQAYVPSPNCAPSRACLASARDYDSAPVGPHDFPVNEATFYTSLQHAGYHTMTVGKDDLTKLSQLGSTNGYHGCSYCQDGDGLYHQAELGFSDGMRSAGKLDVNHHLLKGGSPHEMYGFFLRNHTVHSEAGVRQTAWDAYLECMKGKDTGAFLQTKPGSACDSLTYYGKLYQDDWTAASAIKLLRRRPRNKPFFLQVNFPGPHDPFLVTADMQKSVSDGRAWPHAHDDHKNVVPGGRCVVHSQAEPSKTPTRCHYAAELENLDRLFDEILQEVKSQGELHRTIVAVSSDHGEMLGDHSQVGKEKPWQGSVAVPLLLAGPHIPAGREVRRPVATVDLAATFLDFAGAKQHKDMTAVSLRSLLLHGDGGHYRSHVSSALKQWRLVVKDVRGKSYKYICCKGMCPGRPSSAPHVSKSGWMEMLIDVQQDPFDMHDLSHRKPKVARQLRKLLPKHTHEGLNFHAGCSSI